VLVLTCVIVLLVLVLTMARGAAAAPLDRLEAIYLAAAPLPAILALILPGVVAALLQDPGSSREWRLWLTKVGGWLSLALIVAGVLLLSRRSSQGKRWDRRLLVGVFVAAMPALLIGLVVLMYAII
jgi:hypothetical protein